MAEIITLEQQRFIKPPGQGVEEAIPEIEASSMTTFAKMDECCAGEFGLIAIQADDVDLCGAEEQIKISLAIGTKACLQNSR